MARIINIEKQDVDRNTVQDVVPATYRVFEKNGSKYIQIDTYGSHNREYPDQPSQKIQFDKTFAKKLISILIEELL
jgi:hypothetical protein